MNACVNRQSRLVPAFIVAAAIAGCSSQGPTIDDAVFSPDPSLPAPKSVTPASPAPKAETAKGGESTEGASTP